MDSILQNIIFFFSLCLPILFFTKKKKLNDFSIYDKNRGGLMVSEGGQLHVRGLFTKIYNNEKFGMFSYMSPSVIYLDFDYLLPENRATTIIIHSNKKGLSKCSGGGTIERIEHMLEGGREKE
jgi:hypothetical protein